MRKLLLLFLAGACIAGAQRFDFGGSLGGGVLASSSQGSSGAGRIGLEACAFCSGRLALFGEYAHWFAAEHHTGFGVGRISRADLAGGGLRIRALGPTPIFFDLGIVGGSDRHGNGGGGAIGGIVIGGGLTLNIGDRWYIRPQVRAYGLSPHTLEGLDVHWAVSAGAGVGVRF